MNYKKIYNNLIEHRQKTPVLGYSERHHIVPSSLGGSNSLQNIVRLSAREHFIAHLLLTKIYNIGSAHDKMVNACIMMLCHSKTHQRYTPSRRYELVKIAFSQVQAQRQSGSNNSQYDTVWIFHELIGPKKISKQLICEYIDQGWFLGRSLKFCKVKISQEIILQNKEIKFKKKYPHLEEWYEIYSKYGFKVFVEKTGYKYSNPNLVMLFSRHLNNFKPYNSRKRGK